VIVQCPGCRSRYRFDESRMVANSTRLRCKKCDVIFTIARPPVRPPAGSTLTESSGMTRSASPATPSRTALIADETREFRDFVAGVLREAGFEVSSTDDGEEALILAGSHRFDLIILNVYLRRLLGRQVCERIKATAGLRETPLILVGSLFQTEGFPPLSGHLFGADEFIGNNITREKLSVTVGRVLAGLPPPPTVQNKQEEVGQASDEAEIRRLARIMISDLQMYHPEKFTRALRDGTFFEAFAEDLGRGKEVINKRFAHVSNRIQLLAAGLRNTLESLRSGSPQRRSAQR